MLPTLRPLGAFERAMVRTQHHAPFNVVIVLGFRHGPSAAVLRAALDTLARRHPLLTCAVVGRPPAFVPTPLPIPLEVCALDSVAISDPECRSQRIEAELAHSFELARGPLCTAKLVGPPDSGTASELLLSFPHLVLDASSGARLIDELVRLCAGEAPEPESAPLLPRLEQHFPPQHRGLAGWLRAVAAMARELSGELGYHLREQAPRVQPGVSRALEIELDRPTTTGLLAELRRRRLTLNSLLVAAWTLAWARSSALRGRSRRRMRVFTMASLRSLVRPPVSDEALGSAWAMKRSIFTVPPSDSEEIDQLAAFAQTVQHQLGRETRRGDALAAWRSAPAMMALALGPRPQRMGELAVSSSGVVDVPTGQGALELDRLQVFVSSMDIGPALVVQQRIWNGALGGGVVFLDCDLDRDEAEAIATRVQDQLCRLASSTTAGASP